MTTAENLAPLLDLPPADLRAERRATASNGLLVSLTNVSSCAAIGVVIEDARSYDEPGWVTFSDNVLDLLPGEERRIEVAGPVGKLRVEGWNARA